MLGLTKITAALCASAATLLAVAVQEDELGYQDTPVLPGSKWHVHDGLRPQPRVVSPGEGTAPPSDAIVLFDGSGTDAWTGGPWTVADGAMTVNGTGGIQTKESFGDCQLHLEWRAPTYEGDEDPRSQGRGNSGVFFFGRYEVQILDCFENETYPDGMTAALYGQEPPMVNACRPAGEWQTYDICFKAPRFGSDGKLQFPAVVTMFHNGVCVHHARAMIGATRHRDVATYGTHEARGPISIQDHSNPVSFRNIWVRPLERAQ
ncbi:MAG: DUF1080 domain-containing protein [Planctomycetota bacterium]